MVEVLNNDLLTQVVMDTQRRAAVYLRVYDISQGAARTWSPIVLGRRVEGVWHTGIEVFGYEYFYGGGVVKMRPENVEKTFGISPLKKHHLGYTASSRVQFETHLQSIRTMFRRDVYDLVNWNCNHFSDHCSRKLTGHGIPDYIVELPIEIGKTFMGKIVLNFIKMLQGGAAPIGVDDPDHPSKRLDNETADKRQRRNSCPASPTSNRVAAADSSIYVDNPNATTFQATINPPATSRPLRHSHRHRTAGPHALASTRTDPTMRLVNQSQQKKRRPSISDGIERIPGAAIGDYQTEVLYSPQHRRLYELERDRFCTLAPTVQARRGSDVLVPPPPFLHKKS